MPHRFCCKTTEDKQAWDWLPSDETGAHAFFFVIYFVVVAFIPQVRNRTSARGRAASGDSPGATS